MQPGFLGKFLSVNLFGCALLVLAGCGNFKSLKQDQENLAEERFLTSVTVEDKTQSGQPFVVVYLGDADGSRILDAIPLSKPDSFEIWLAAGDGWIFAFTDANGDGRFQKEESYGWGNEGEPILAQDQKSVQLYVPIQNAGSGQMPPPPKLVDQPVYELGKLRFRKSGEVANPSDARFSQEAAVRGLWQPYAFLHEGNTGLFFVQPFDPQKTPVLFVHGIEGYPAQFNYLIDFLDQDRYQFWFLNYPSGLYLKTISDSLFYLVEEVRREFGFKKIHLIAHSMGGLVARSYLARCQEQAACGYIDTFISIASPFNGVESAAKGVKHAPAYAPSWMDLAPDSEFLSELFDKALPVPTQHYLMFTYHLDQSIGALAYIESGDGVIPLHSQLRKEAQQQAIQIMGFDQTHVGVLSDPALADTIGRILYRADH